MNARGWATWTVIGLAAIGAVIVIVFAAAVEDGLDGMVWMVDSVAVDGVAEAPPPGSAFTVEFQDRMVSGRASCNDYYGGYLTEGSNIDMGPLELTLRTCVPDTEAFEKAFIAALDSGTHYRQDGGLALFDADDTVRIRLSANPLGEVDFTTP